MKVQSIQNYSQANYKNQKQNSNKVVVSSPNFGIGTSYGYYYPNGSGSSSKVAEWSARKLNILNRDHSEMEDLAEYLHIYSDEELSGIANEAHWISYDNASRAASRLISYVTPIRQKKAEMVKRAENLERHGTSHTELRRLKEEIQRLDNKASQAWDKFKS